MKSALSHAVRRSTQIGLRFESPPALDLAVDRSGARAIESEDFPFEMLSDVAESESWRKEINRPLSHLHKWWAQRLGSVFRAVVAASLAPQGANVEELFYSRARFSGATVYDPFMGSGTTVIEALKLGARAIGRDINPVAHFLVSNAVAKHDLHDVLRTFSAIERDVSERIKSFYCARLPDGSQVSVLYYFWVKQVACPRCSTAVDLFSSYVFAQNAYPKRHPQARALCPQCGGINQVRYDAEDVKCGHCDSNFNPAAGPSRGQKATCTCCNHEFSIAKSVRLRDTPPDHKLYAKLVLLPNGEKEYLAADDFDRKLFEKAAGELANGTQTYPIVGIEPGYNTNQALGYNYQFWHQFFNARQLLCLSMLADRIRAIEEPEIRELFTCLFSGVLEFNNMFASYKGEGTGAVRHMFSHHILKPERTPLEANPWGTPRSSGSFLTMFETRILRALRYADDPFELKLSDDNTAEKIFGLSEPIGFEAAHSFAGLKQGRRVYLSCGDSSSTDIPEASVDAVITDPPFFDNVHYSQLADFFHVWQRHILGAGGTRQEVTTRAIGEVQHCDEPVFRERLTTVWTECFRVLKNDGLLVFTYHHSRPEGWSAVLRALTDGGFGIVAVHPIKAEMSVAMPKTQAKEPIDLDIVLVCRKLKTITAREWTDDAWAATRENARRQIDRLRAAKRGLSRNDVRVIVMAHLIKRLSLIPTAGVRAIELLDANIERTDAAITALHSELGDYSNL